MLDSNTQEQVYQEDDTPDAQFLLSYFTARAQTNTCNIIFVIFILLDL